MKNPVFLLQKGDVLASEKIACSLSEFPVSYCGYDDLFNLSPKESFSKYIPLGSVEYTQRYADHVGIKLPVNISYLPPVLDFVKREIRQGKYRDASLEDFVKPYEKIKSFTGDVKERIINQGIEIDGEEDVWVSESVPFESEFRFYIQDFAVNWEIAGWSRYDSLDVVNPGPDINLVRSLAEEIHKDLGPNAYTIDIGWRPDIEEYDIVEVNDAWALGLYRNLDPQSNPPTNQQYADMLYSRWLQIVFCNLEF